MSAFIWTKDTPGGIAESKAAGPSTSESLRKEMDRALREGAAPKLARFALACLQGSPFLGGMLGGMAGFGSGGADDRLSKLAAAWLQFQEQELLEIGLTLMEVMSRLDLDDPDVEK